MKRDIWLSKFKGRQARVVHLREKLGLTFEEIGKKLKPPVSRQAASKLYKKGLARALK